MNKDYDPMSYNCFKDWEASKKMKPRDISDDILKFVETRIDFYKDKNKIESIKGESFDAGAIHELLFLKDFILANIKH